MWLAVSFRLSDSGGLWIPIRSVRGIFSIRSPSLVGNEFEVKFSLMKNNCLEHMH